MPPGMGSLSDPITSFAFLTALGMNNRMNELDFDGKYVLYAQNCRYAQMPASVIKRPPLAYYNPTTMSTTQGVVGLYRFYSFYGPLLIATCGSTVYVGDDSTGTMTAIASLSNAGKQMMFVTYNNLLIASNGYDPILVYDGNPQIPAMWQLGSAQAVIASTGTGITATSISYTITMDTDAYVNGAISNVIATVTNQAITLNYIPLGPVGTVNRRIYRKDSGTSNNYLLVATIADNSTTTYTDTTPSASLGAGLPTLTDPMPIGAWILIFGERLFITADPNNLNRIYYSEPFLPGYIQVDTNLDYLDVAKDDGDQIQGIAVETGTMICIKQNNMRRLNISTAQANVDPSTWNAEEPFCYVGTPARYSICQTQYGIVLLSWDFWYRVSGLQAEPIIPEFDTTQILPAAYNNVLCGYNDGMLYASYANAISGDQFATQVMVYDFKLQMFSLDTYSAGAFASGTGVNESGQLYIGDATQGFVYEISRGDIEYTLAGLSQAELGTGSNIFIGGTQNDPFIQIGGPSGATQPLSIPVGVCIFWDDFGTGGTLPGSGWTEITTYPYTYPVISTVSGSTGGSSSHVHLLSGTTNTVIGPLAGINIEQSGPGNVLGEGGAHDHVASQNSDSAYADPAFFGLRIFYKNSTTTEYEFPVGSILMWDQSNSPDGWIPYSQSNKGYLKLISPVAFAPNWALGTSYTVGQTVTAIDPFSLQPAIYYCQINHTAGAYDTAFNNPTNGYGIQAGSASTVPSSFAAGAEQQYPISPLSFADDLAAGFWIAQYDNLGITVNATHSHSYGVFNEFGTLVEVPSGVILLFGYGPMGASYEHFHQVVGVTNATQTGGNWDLDRLEVNFIKKLLTGETPWDGTNKNVIALFYDSQSIDSYTVLLLHLNTNTTDSSSYSNTIINSAVTFSSSIYKFSGGSAVFPSNGFLSTPNASIFTLGSGDWTVDAWVNTNSSSQRQTVLSQWADNNNYFLVDYTGSLNSLTITCISGGVNVGNFNVTASTTLTPGTWYHLAFVRHGASAYIFINGVSQALTVLAPFGTMGSVNAALQVGAYATGGFQEFYWNGYLQEVRFSVGIARWTSNFTPQTFPYANSASASNGWTDISASIFAYSSTASYVAGNMVTFGGNYYQCIQACMNQEPDTSPTYWQGGAYSSSTAYTIGQYATVSSVGYACIQASTNNAPASSPTYWQPISIYLKSTPSIPTPQANNGYIHNHGNTPAVTTSFSPDYSGVANPSPLVPAQHQHILTMSSNSVAIPNPVWVSFRLWEALLGKMVPWNSAVSVEYNNGLYYSPPLQLNISTFGQLYFNASTTGTDQINVYFRSGSTGSTLGSAQPWDSSAVTWDSANPYDYVSSSIVVTPNHSTSTFAATANGFLPGSRISFVATTMPTGISGSIMYYVLYVDANDFQVSLTNGGSAVAFTTNGSNVEAIQWFDEISISGTTITATPNVWVQYAIEFIAANTIVSNPTLYTANEFMLKFGYSRVGAFAETAVEFIYTTGRMNSLEPYVDKIFKRFASDHTGSTGQVKITWATENATNGWTWDLSAYPSKWTAYFQDSAMGETLSVTYYKNDLNDFNLRQFKIQYTPQPMII